MLIPGEISGLTVHKRPYGGAGGHADSEPLGGSLQTGQYCAAVRDGICGVSFAQESLRALFFVRQIVCERLVLNCVRAAILQIVKERHEVWLGD